MTVRVELSSGEARRIALAAQGLSGSRPRKPTLVHVRKAVRGVHALQIDSINVLVRAHYLPVFSRLGQYSAQTLDRLINDRRELVELDAHQASFVPVELEPLLRWRRARRYRDLDAWLKRFERRRPGFLEEVERAVMDHGPVSASDLSVPGAGRRLDAEELDVKRADGQPYAESSLRWWRSSDGREALDTLLAQGRLALAGRRNGFERLYDLPDRVYPSTVLEKPTPPEEDAKRALVLLSAQALGVATVSDLASYFMLKIRETGLAVQDLVDQGDLLPARVEGWKDAAYLHRDARQTGSLHGGVLLSPFDSLTWSRPRTARLFGFEFSFEIYVSEKERRYGYYVLPYLLGEALVARVDLKSDRTAGKLLVQSAFAEPGTGGRGIVPILAESLQLMASWLGLGRVEVGDRGDLAKPLRTACG